ncbi:bacteriocin-like protein [Chryseobacterium oryctis]
MKNLKKLSRNELKSVNGGCMAVQCTFDSCPEGKTCITTTCGIKCR